MRSQGCLVTGDSYQFDLLHLAVEATTITRNICRGGNHWRDQLIRVGQVQGVAFARRCFFPTKGVVAYNAANLLSLANAASLSVSLSDSDIAMVNFLLGGPLAFEAKQRWQCQSCLPCRSTRSNYCTLCCCCCLSALCGDR
jgi:hypothetical protein